MSKKPKVPHQLFTRKTLTNASEEMKELIAEKAKNLVDKPDGYKPKILWVNESSVLATGFSVYGHEILTRLQATGKYEIAEIGSYVHPGDERLKDIPWKHYAVMPKVVKNPKTGKPANLSKDVQKYNSKRTNQFGEWIYNDVLLEFKPDIVIDIRDHWMVEFEERTEYRKNFIWILLVPVDGHPQKWQWIATYERADKVLGYSHYAKKVLESQSGGKIKVEAVASPGVDLEVFKPLNKIALKEQYFMAKRPEELMVIGTVMRNQARKLYPNLFQALAMYHKKYPEEAAKTVLHVHTSVPDVGWDIHESISRTCMVKNVTLTYVCQDAECGHVFASFMMGDPQSNYMGVCQKCGKKTAKCPNTQNGVSREKLAEIYNLFDIYVQFSIAEGFGMPIVEAKACGVPVMCTDNTAMSEQARNGGGFPIPVVKDGDYPLVTENIGGNTGLGMREWEIPSREKLVEMFHKFFNLSQTQRDLLGKQARECAEKFYSWDDCFKIWDGILSMTKIKDRAIYWDKPANLLNPKNIVSYTDEMSKMTNEEFVIYLYKEVLLQDVDDQHKGYQDWITGMAKTGIGRDQVLEYFINIAKAHNLKENKRFGLVAESNNQDNRIILI